MFQRFLRGTIRRPNLLIATFLNMGIISKSDIPVSYEKLMWKMRVSLASLLQTRPAKVNAIGRTYSTPPWLRRHRLKSPPSSTTSSKTPTTDLSLLFTSIACLPSSLLTEHSNASCEWKGLDVGAEPERPTSAEAKYLENGNFNTVYWWTRCNTPPVTQGARRTNDYCQVVLWKKKHLIMSMVFWSFMIQPIFSPRIVRHKIQVFRQLWNWKIWNS